MFCSRRCNSVRPDRGAALVEYALGVSLIVLGLVGGLQYVQSGAESKLSDRGNAIGHPSEVPATTTTVKPGGGTSTTSTTSTTAPFSVMTMGTCNGNPSRNACTFTLDPPPDPAAIVEWKIDPPTGVVGTLPGPVTLTSPGSYTVQATVNDVQTSPLVITCVTKGTGGNIDCDPQ